MSELTNPTFVELSPATKELLDNLKAQVEQLKLDNASLNLKLGTAIVAHVEVGQVWMSNRKGTVEEHAFYQIEKINGDDVGLIQVQSAVYDGYRRPSTIANLLKQYTLQK